MKDKEIKVTIAKRRYKTPVTVLSEIDPENHSTVHVIASLNHNYRCGYRELARMTVASKYYDVVNTAIESLDRITHRKDFDKDRSIFS